MRGDTCEPWEAGLASTERAVARRIARLVEALDTELTGNVVHGTVVDTVRNMREQLVGMLEEDGWRIKYGSGSRPRVTREPEPRGGWKVVRVFWRGGPQQTVVANLTEKQCVEYLRQNKAKLSSATDKSSEAKRITKQRGQWFLSYTGMGK